MATRNLTILKVYEGPKLRVWEVQVEGPLIEQWPPAGHELLYGDLGRNEVTEKNAPSFERIRRGSLSTTIRAAIAS